MIGEQIGMEIGILPATQVASTVNGPAIVRPASCSVLAITGATTGTPSSFTVNMKAQDSDDGTSGWADVSGATVPTITTINTMAELNWRAAPKAFIRIVSVVAFVAGTAPTVAVAAIVATGGSRTYPV